MLRLTSLPNHAPSPRAVVIHLHDASLNFPAVMGSLRLPILTVGTPYGQAIAPTREDIASIKRL